MVWRGGYFVINIVKNDLHLRRFHKQAKDIKQKSQVLYISEQIPTFASELRLRLVLIAERFHRVDILGISFVAIVLATT